MLICPFLVKQLTIWWYVEGMTFMLCNHVHPVMALKGDKPSTTENCTFWTTGPAWTGSTTSPREIVDAPLKPNSIRPGFSRVDDGNPICLNADIYNRSAELPESTKIHLTSKSLIPSVRMRASSCGCNTQLGSTGERWLPRLLGVCPHRASWVGLS